MLHFYQFYQRVLVVKGVSLSILCHVNTERNKPCCVNIMNKAPIVFLPASHWGIMLAWPWVVYNCSCWVKVGFFYSKPGQGALYCHFI